MFDIVDFQGNEYISVSGLHALLSKDLGMNVSVEDMYEIVASVDEDGNGKLDRDEFGTLLRSLGVF